MRNYTKIKSNLDNPSGAFAYNLITSAAKWDEMLYDLYFEKGEDAVREYVESNSDNNFMYIEYSYKQLGKDDKWLAKMIKELNNDMVLVKRELLLQWTYSSSDSVFKEEELDLLSRYADKDYVGKLIFKDKYIMYMIKKPSNLYKKNWIVSIDIAGGLGKDKTAITVIDPLDNKPIMVMYNNTMTVPDLVEVVKELIDTYMPNAVIIPERNNMGTTFIELMIKSPKYERNMFYSIKTRKTEKIVQEDKNLFRKKPKYVNRETRVFGIDTTTKNRKIMTEDILSMLVKERPDHINNRDIFAEIKTLEKTKTGKIEHSSNGHDDLLMSYLIGMYTILYEQEALKRFVKVVEDYVSPIHKLEEVNKTNSNIISIGNISKLIEGSSNSIIDEALRNSMNKRTLEQDVLESTKKSRTRFLDKLNSI